MLICNSTCCAVIGRTGHPTALVNLILFPGFGVFADVGHTQGPLDGSLYARVRKKDSLEGVVTINGLPLHENLLTDSQSPVQQQRQQQQQIHPQVAEHTLPVTGHASLPAVDHTLSVSSDSGNSTASVKTDRTDEHSQSGAPPHVGVGSGVAQGNPAVLGIVHPGLSPQEKRELEQLLSGLEPPSRQTYISTSTSPGGSGGVRHLVPAQVHVNGGHAKLVAAPSAEEEEVAEEGERETDILDDGLPDSKAGNSVDSLGTLSSLEGRDHYYQPPTVGGGHRQNEDGPYLERGNQMPVQEHPLLEPSRYQNGDGMYKHQLQSSGQRQPAGGSTSPGLESSNPKLMPRAPERSTSSREAVQRGLSAWHQSSLPDDPFGPPLQSTHSLPLLPASQRDIEQSIEALNMLMLDLDSGHGHMHGYMSKSLSAPPPAPLPFSQSLARPSYQGDSAIHGHANGSLLLLHGAPWSAGRSETCQQQNATPSNTTEPYLNTRPQHHQYQQQQLLQDHHHLEPTSTFSQQVAPAPPRSPQSPELQASSPYPGYSLASSPLLPLSPAPPKDTSSSSLPREQDGEEEALNLEGLVAHRIAGRGKQQGEQFVHNFKSKF